MTKISFALKIWFIIFSFSMPSFAQSEFKISKFKNKMIQSIAKICELSPKQINIKGKTTEKLGLIGKEKAIACEVITSVIKYA